MKPAFTTHLRALIVKQAHETQTEPVTQKEVSAITGIAQSTLSRWYQGKVDRLDAETVAKLMAYFDCTFGDLVTLTLETAE